MQLWKGKKNWFIGEFRCDRLNLTETTSSVNPIPNTKSVNNNLKTEFCAKSTFYMEKYVEYFNLVEVTYIETQ